MSIRTYLNIPNLLHKGQNNPMLRFSIPSFKTDKSYHLMHVMILSFSLLLSISNVGAEEQVPEPNETLTADSSVPYELERLQWHAELSKKQSIRLSNPWGDIRIRQTGDQTAVLHAVMQKIGHQPKVASIEHKTVGDAVQLSIQYPQEQQPANVKEGRVDAVLVVPYGTPVEVISDRGRVITKTMESPLKVSAKDESVSVKTHGPIQISTKSAPVEVYLLNYNVKSSNQHESSQIQTLNGDIELKYYQDLPLNVELVSGASKSTNDIALLESRSRSGRKVSMHKGLAKHLYKIQSDTGRIILTNMSLEQPPLEKQ